MALWTPQSGGAPTSRAPQAVRVGSHLVVWAALVVPLVVVLVRGWIPSGDDAAIAIRSYQTFSLHPPLVGLVSTVGTGTGHYVSDPGPLLFWLLAVPVRIDPLHGPLWGAALLSGIVLSVAIEALWSAGQWLAGAVVAFVVADYLCFAPAVVENIVWNAYLPIPFFIAAIALAWVVAGGSFGWWPVLVFAGSVAAQSQLIYALPAVALVVVTPILALGLGSRPPRLRWLVVGVAVGGACWLAPLLQSLGPAGNLAALATSTHGLPRWGIGWGLRVIGTAGSPAPLWLHTLPTQFFQVLGTIAVNGPALGVVVLGILTVIAAWAWRGGRRMLCALSLVTLVCSLTVGAGFALVPTRNSLNLAYMITVLWALSLLVWSVVLWALVLVATATARRLAGPDVARPRVAGGPKWAAVVLVVPTVALVLGAAALRSYQPGLVNVGTSASDSRLLPRIASQVERAAPRRHVVLRVHEVGVTGLQSFWLTEGAAWSLEAAGWHPGLEGMARAYTGLVPQPGSAVYQVTVDPGDPSAAVQIGHPHQEPGRTLPSTSTGGRSGKFGR